MMSSNGENKIRPARTLLSRTVEFANIHEGSSSLSGITEGEVVIYSTSLDEICGQLGPMVNGFMMPAPNLGNDTPRTILQSQGLFQESDGMNGFEEGRLPLGRPLLFRNKGGRVSPWTFSADPT